MFYRTVTGANDRDLSLIFIFIVRVEEEVNMGLQATNAGIDFQQRVSAYMMILMEFDMDISLALQVNKSNTIKEINFEDCESIDDLVITLDSGKKIYFQMKRTISLSDDSESEFFGVCEQFVNQFLKQSKRKDNRYKMK